MTGFWIGVEKAFIIAQCSFPIMATVVAVVALGEAFTWLTAVGAMLLVYGIYLIVARNKNAPDLATIAVLDPFSHRNGHGRRGGTCGIGHLYHPRRV